MANIAVAGNLNLSPGDMRVFTDMAAQIQQKFTDAIQSISKMFKDVGVSYHDTPGITEPDRPSLGSQYHSMFPPVDVHVAGAFQFGGKR